MWVCGVSVGYVDLNSEDWFLKIAFLVTFCNTMLYLGYILIYSNHSNYNVFLIDMGWFYVVEMFTSLFWNGFVEWCLKQTYIFLSVDGRKWALLIKKYKLVSESLYKKNVKIRKKNADIFSWMFSWDTFSLALTNSQPLSWKQSNTWTY